MENLYVRTSTACPEYYYSTYTKVTYEFSELVLTYHKYDRVPS